MLIFNQITTEVFVVKISLPSLSVKFSDLINVCSIHNVTVSIPSTKVRFRVAKRGIFRQHRGTQHFHLINWVCTYSIIQCNFLNLGINVFLISLIFGTFIFLVCIDIDVCSVFHNPFWIVSYIGKNTNLRISSKCSHFLVSLNRFFNIYFAIYLRLW